jgi:hypothetical protein
VIINRSEKLFIVEFTKYFVTVFLEEILNFKNPGGDREKSIGNSGRRRRVAQYILNRGFSPSYLQETVK